jgi:molybdopterin-dependent oxidoreductase alpha subunit
VRRSERIIVCWCTGLTQHRNAPANIQELLNLLLIRGAMGKPGAGACCVRGHSNVQGDRTMGVWERPAPEFLDALEQAFAFAAPRDPGLDSVKSVKAMHDGRVKVFISLGGNFLRAVPDTAYAAEALSRTRLTVRIGTKLNRSDLVTGQQALILPCLGRAERDIAPATATRPEAHQFVSCENSMGVVERSLGHATPASPALMGETAIVCRMAHAVLGTRSRIDWLAWATDYDLIRDGIAAAIPGCDAYNARVRHPGGFYLPNPPRENVFHTPVGKALFTVNPIAEHRLEPGQLLMMTVRSHDQFNTTIYGLHDRYRGLHFERRVVMMNREDLEEQRLSPRQVVDVTCHFNGQTRTASGFRVVEYPIPRHCAAMYYPEANVLVPIGATEPLSNIPGSKSVVISLRPAALAVA